MRGKPEGSNSNPLTKERFLERAVGTCPGVNICIGGDPARCLLDTGSSVSTLTESFSESTSMVRIKILSVQLSG